MKKKVKKSQKTTPKIKEIFKLNLGKLQNFNFRKFLSFKFILIVFSAILLSGILIDFTTNSSLSANLADSVLRPLIGSKNTIFLESLVFAGEDSVNQLAYKFIIPKSNLSNNFPTTKIASSQREMGGSWVLSQTSIRPDPDRPYAIVSLVKMDMKKLRLSAVAGTVEPGGALGHRGPGKIPSQIQNSNQLVAAFNGGFQERDGQYGMMVGGETYLPLKKGLATLVIDQDSNLKIVDYEGQNLGSSNAIIRQNGQMLVSNSQIVPSSDNNQFSIWGRTVTRSMYTWRSGIGITKDGNLIYAVGPSLVPETLAKALLQAGAIDAMQLDINPYWVRFVIFSPIGSGKYRHYSLFKNMYDGGEQFLHGYQKDFFYLYQR